MKRKHTTDDIGRKLARHLAKEMDVQVVHHPDHPFLFDSPDLLVASPGNLVAVFILRVKERQSSDALFARLAVSRLALPQNLRCILLIPENAYSDKVSNLAGSHFHEVLPSKDSKSLKAFIRDENAKGNIEEVPSDVKTKTFQRFEIFFSESKKNVKFAPKTPAPKEQTLQQENSAKRDKTKLIDDLFSRQFKPTEIHNWTFLEDKIENKKISQRILRENYWVVGVVSENWNTSINEKIKPLCRDIIQVSYDFDAGVPYYRGKTANILVADSLQLKGYDPEKSIRAAAFAGWTMTFENNSNEIVEDLEKLFDTLYKLRL